MSETEKKRPVFEGKKSELRELTQDFIYPLESGSRTVNFMRTVQYKSYEGAEDTTVENIQVFFYLDGDLVLKIEETKIPQYLKELLNDEKNCLEALCNRTLEDWDKLIN